MAQVIKITDLSIDDRLTLGPPVSVELNQFRLPLSGVGYLAGQFPDGITTVEGVPVNATVRVLLRTVAGHPGDGSLVAEVESAPDGTWRVDGLPTGFKYDVVGRKAGFNDVIMADISPTVG